MPVKRRYSRKQQERLLEIFMMTTLVALGITVVLILGYVYVNCSIYKNNRSIEDLSNDLTEIQEQIDTTKAKEVEYKSQLDELQSQLSKYQSIIIPDSMQSEGESN